MVILDTDMVSILLRASSPERNRLLDRLEPIPLQEKATTIISYEEQTRGWLSYAKKAANQAQVIEAYLKLKHHLDGYCKMLVLKFDQLAAIEFQRLRKQALRIGTMDLRIAAIALAHNAMLLSRNLSDFRKVPGLTVEDWTT